MFRKALVVLILLTASAFAGNTKIYVPRTEDGRIIGHEMQTNPKPEAMRSMVSRKNLLGLDRDKPFGLPKSKNGVPMLASVQDVDTIHVLVLRVEFQTEDPDDPTTTGNGNFDLRPQEEFVAEEGHDFDPAPHNAAYFNMHMEALRRYWYYVSDRQLRITWDIYPEEENASYRLSHSMSHYGSRDSIPDIVGGLDAFVRDAVQLADTTTPEINFADYQAIIIFHAGADQQNNFDFIYDTPSDLWTGFLWTDSTIAVDNGSVEVREATIMPETASQDNRITVLNGVMAHEFGHQLGLVDIYNTGNFLTQVGNYSLMDNNGSNIAVELDTEGNLVMGTLPSYPDAWSRAYLGFSGVTEVTSGDDILLRAAEQNHHTNEIIKVPISDMEYYLIENRQTESDFEYLHVEGSTPHAILADSATGVILGPGWGYTDNSGVVKVANGEYDRLLPGDGILIWHVDEVVAYLDYALTGYNNFKANTLQWDYRRRFLSLVEGDGIIDFGGNYYTGFGDPGDYFMPDRGMEFTPSTNPATVSNLGADTHISITDIKSVSADTILSVDVGTDWDQEGFPVMGFPDIGFTGGGLIAANLDADSDNELLMARGRLLLAINPDGSPVMDTSSAVIIPQFDAVPDTFLIPLFAVLDNNITGKVIAADMIDDAVPEVACFDGSDKFYVFKSIDTDPVDSLADIIDTVAVGSNLSAGPVAYDFDHTGQADVLAGFYDQTLRLFRVRWINGERHVLMDTLAANLMGLPTGMCVADDTVFVTQRSAQTNSLLIGALTDSALTQLAPIHLPTGDFHGIACGDINRDNAIDVVITIGDNLCLYDGESGDLKTIAVESPGPPSLGDIDSDGYPDIVFSAGNDVMKVYAFHSNGSIFNEFPQNLGKMQPYSRLNQPLLADVDADSLPDIILTLPSGSLYWNTVVYYKDPQDSTNILAKDTTLYLTSGGLTGMDYHGNRLGGFPLSSSSAYTVEPVVSDLDGDGDIEIAAIDSTGFINVWNLDAACVAIDQPWMTADGNNARTGFLSPSFNKVLNSASGYLADGAVYNYPNPASNLTTFRYYVDRPADINIKIFDMSGELVDELNGSTLGGIEDEIPWNCSKYASGVYFARFEADSQDINKNVMIKVALIK